MQVKNFKLNFLYYWGPPAVHIYDLPITTLFIYLFYMQHGYHQHHYIVALKLFFLNHDLLL